LVDGDSEVIRDLVIAHLTERGYLMPKKNQTNQATYSADEFRMLDTMIYSLVEAMDAKRQVKYSDWEARLRKKVHET